MTARGNVDASEHALQVTAALEIRHFLACNSLFLDAMLCRCTAKVNPIAADSTTGPWGMFRLRSLDSYRGDEDFQHCVSGWRRGASRFSAATIVEIREHRPC